MLIFSPEFIANIKSRAYTISLAAQTDIFSLFIKNGYCTLTKSQQDTIDSIDTKLKSYSVLSKAMVSRASYLVILGTIFITLPSLSIAVLSSPYLSIIGLSLLVLSASLYVTSSIFSTYISWKRSKIIRLNKDLLDQVEYLAEEKKGDHKDINFSKALEVTRSINKNCDDITGLIISIRRKLLNLEGKEEVRYIYFLRRFLEGLENEKENIIRTQRNEDNLTNLSRGGILKAIKEQKGIQGLSKEDNVLPPEYLIYNYLDFNTQDNLLKFSQRIKGIVESINDNIYGNQAYNYIRELENAVLSKRVESTIQEGSKIEEESKIQEESEGIKKIEVSSKEHARDAESKDETERTINEGVALRFTQLQTNAKVLCEYDKYYENNGLINKIDSIFKGKMKSKMVQKEGDYFQYLCRKEIMEKKVVSQILKRLKAKNTKSNEEKGESQEIRLIRDLRELFELKYKNVKDEEKEKYQKEARSENISISIKKDIHFLAKAIILNKKNKYFLSFGVNKNKIHNLRDEMVKDIFDLFTPIEDNMKRQNHERCLLDKENSLIAIKNNKLLEPGHSDGTIIKVLKIKLRHKLQVFFDEKFGKKLKEYRRSKYKPTDPSAFHVAILKDLNREYEKKLTLIKNIKNQKNEFRKG